MVIIDCYVCLCKLMNTRRCVPINPRLTKKHFPENRYDFFEKLDLNKVRFNVVGGSSNRTCFGGKILKTDDFTGSSSCTCFGGKVLKTDDFTGSSNRTCFGGKILKTDDFTGSSNLHVLVGRFSKRMTSLVSTILHVN